MNTLALIPARSGSTGVPNKNFRDFCGKPLWVWAYEVGKETCDLVRVSSDKTESMGMGWEVGLFRPKDLCQDDTPMLPVVQHALDVSNRFAAYRQKVEVVVLLQPTQPLRRPEHVRAALKLLEETGADSVVSVVEIPGHFHPQKALKMLSDPGARCDGDLWPWDGDWHILTERRQDCIPAYARDGTVYAIRRETIEAGSLYGDKCVPLIIPHSESCNIDTEIDWKRAEAMKGQADA